MLEDSVVPTARLPSSLESDEAVMIHTKTLCHRGTDSWLNQCFYVHTYNSLEPNPSLMHIST